jgi:hypothetical protein
MQRTARSLRILAWTLALAAVGCAPPATPPYVPRLGEIMTLSQMRHVKLWFAGEANNWPLAAYELDEIKEGLDDAVRYHPTHEGSQLPISGLVPKMTAVPMRQVDEAIDAKDRVRFEQAFDELTAACNSCHQAANFGFNVVTRPRANPYVNQVFEPPR